MSPNDVRLQLNLVLWDPADNCNVTFCTKGTAHHVSMDGCASAQFCILFQTCWWRRWLHGRCIIVIDGTCFVVNVHKFIMNDVCILLEVHCVWSVCIRWLYRALFTDCLALLLFTHTWTKTEPKIWKKNSKEIRTSLAHLPPIFHFGHIPFACYHHFHTHRCRIRGLDLSHELCTGVSTQPGHPSVGSCMGTSVNRHTARCISPIFVSCGLIQLIGFSGSGKDFKLNMYRRLVSK